MIDSIDKAKQGQDAQRPSPWQEGVNYMEALSAWQRKGKMQENFLCQKGIRGLKAFIRARKSKVHGCLHHGRKRIKYIEIFIMKEKR